MENVKKPFYKYCLVPICKNSTRKTPDKVFFQIPRDAKIRQKWCELIGRCEEVSLKSCVYCCEDHFDIEQDTENYMQYKIMKEEGIKVSLRLKKGVVPHIFHRKKSMDLPLVRRATKKQILMKEMSSKNTRKAAKVPKPIEPIITRTKSAQLRNKAKETKKPELTKPQPKSTKPKKPVIRRVISKNALLKSPVESTAELLEQVEYYPNKLKRDVSSKKISLKPQHNFKVVATTNKRKLTTPQKGLKSPPTQNSPSSLLKSKVLRSPELSMQDMVRLMEETTSLSDEDLMEILTCPSPVWWEDPPEEDYDEESICTSSPTPSEDINQSKITKATNKPNDISIIKTQQTQTALNKNDEKFVKKKQKLENILGLIKNKSLKPINEINSDRKRFLSESEGDISDLSLNEEEVINNLENMDIPIEQAVIKCDSQINIEEANEIEIKKELINACEVATKNDNVVREANLPLDVKPVNKNEMSVKSSVFHSDCTASSSKLNIDSLGGMDSNDEVVIVDSCKNSSIDNKKRLNSSLDYNMNTEFRLCKDANNSHSNHKSDLPNKKSDLSEFITVYKIIPEKLKKEYLEDPKSFENINKHKLGVTRGKLNTFFKQCKSIKRSKKIDSSLPAIPLTVVKEEITDNEKENGDSAIDLTEEKIRLKGCDSCVEKTDNGTSNCEKCELAPKLTCNSCNFLADNKEVYKSHISSCKDVARISWNQNYVLNQT